MLTNIVLDSAEEQVLSSTDELEEDSNIIRYVVQIYRTFSSQNYHISTRLRRFKSLCMHDF